MPGADFFSGRGGESAMRLAFSYPSPAEIEEGVRRLASAVRDALLLRRAACAPTPVELRGEHTAEKAHGEQEDA